MDRPQQDMRYTIEEVSDLSGLKAHVLRYWESEFPQLKPARGSSNQRQYRQKDLDLILHIKKLVYEKGFTLQGARNQLKEDIKEARLAGQLPLSLDLGSSEAVGALVKARRQARALLDFLDRTQKEVAEEGGDFESGPQEFEEGEEGKSDKDDKEA
jgi:DNA-binding transcriptional MerR regulator